MSVIPPNSGISDEEWLKVSFEWLNVIKRQIDMRMNDYLADIKSDHNGSIVDSTVGFNEAWGIVSKVFAECLGEHEK